MECIPQAGFSNFLESVCFGKCQKHCDFILAATLQTLRFLYNLVCIVWSWMAHMMSKKCVYTQYIYYRNPIVITRFSTLWRPQAFSNFLESVCLGKFQKHSDFVLAATLQTPRFSYDLVWHCMVFDGTHALKYITFKRQVRTTRTSPQFTAQQNSPLYARFL